MVNISKTMWLPTSKKEIESLGWEQPDVILFSGDAYVDHPSFGIAVIGRILEHAGFKVAIVPQPNWRDDLRDFKKLRPPRLFFGISSGAMDSMVNHYTANKRIRSNDAYTPNGQAGFRPDYAVSVYSNILKQLYPEIPVVIGGIEASLRRLTHYDYWSDSLMPSILYQSKADILVYGMGEKAIVQIAKLLDEGSAIQTATTIPQTAYISQVEPEDVNYVKLYSFQQCTESKTKFGQNFALIETESNRVSPSNLVEEGPAGFVIVNAPFPTATTAELDSYHDLPFTYLPHPRYDGKGAIPAFEMIKTSINIHRGCFGGCSFCTISAHQGKFVTSRSQKSIINEINKIKELPDFKGYLSDLGGPSANMYMMKGKDLTQCEKCRRPSCIFPKICKNLNTSHRPLLDLYHNVSKIEGIKKAFIGSGIRYDLFLTDGVGDPFENYEYLKEVILHHTSGRLKVAPEHTAPSVLKRMRKPDFGLFEKLDMEFNKINRSAGVNFQLIPYFISSHPGSTEQEMRQLSDVTRSLDFKLEQVQDFTPTPMTLSSTIFYTGIDPYTGEKVYVARTKEEKLRQRDYFFWYKKPQESRAQSNRNNWKVRYKKK
ncbi:MAG TPA: YgiQ family radical SAM protein [Williamwhitmania sp.]|nr:YgiQ family radical SAM protein [Williamwhitmania sp.]